MSEPVIVRLDATSTRSAALADVLIVDGDGRTDGEIVAELFGRYPGLALTLVVHPTYRVAAVFRDNTTPVVRLDDALRALAGLLYRRWIEVAEDSESTADG